MSEAQLRTFMEVAMASIQTTMIELEGWEGAPERVIDAFCELEQAFARVQRAKRLLK